MAQSDAQFELAQLLTEARRRVHRARVLAELPSAALRAVSVLAVVSGLFWLIRFAGLLLETETVVGWGGFVVLSLLGMFAAAAYTVAAEVRRPPTDREVAERLDLAAADHNRIATALALASKGERGAFALAAVEDGLIHARRLADREPHPDRPRDLRPQIRRAATTAALMLVLAAICGGRAGRADTPGVALLPQALAQSERRPPQKADETVVQSRPAPVAPAGRETGPRQSAATQPEPLGAAEKEQVSAGKTGGASAAQSNASSQSSKGSGESTGSSAQRKPDAKRPPAGKAKRPDTKSPPPSKPEKGDEEDSSISQGSSGGSAASPVQNNWSQQSQSSETDQDNEDEDDVTESESEQSNQRGGVQPSLKDREAAPSRELGISGDDQGLPGTGRGGPTPPKKSRGTASLVLGIPIPDFIKARLGPGNTKVVHERVDPAPVSGEAARPAEAAPRTGAEASIDVPRVSADEAAIVQQYLIRLHSADAERNQESAK